MSDIYIQRLRSVRDELDIARDIFRFILENWHRQEVANDFRLRTRNKMQEAEQNLEKTYFVRLTAEFEGILKDHLRTNHPAVAFPARRRDWTVDRLLSKVLQQENITLDSVLRQRLDEVRDYRNTIAHGNPAIIPISFSTALARYTTFLSKLPEPYK